MAGVSGSVRVMGIGLGLGVQTLSLTLTTDFALLFELRVTTNDDT